LPFSSQSVCQFVGLCGRDEADAKMKTQLVHSYSTASLSNLSTLSRSSSAVSFSSKGFDFRNPGASNNVGNIAGLDEEPSPQSPFKTLCKQVFKKKFLVRKFPIVNWFPNYSVQKLIADFIAGITVGLTILPQGLAYATIANLPPQVSQLLKFHHFSEKYESYFSRLESKNPCL